MTLRRGHANTYAPTHGERFPPLASSMVHATRSCGKCGLHQVNKGGAKHPVYGWIGLCCARSKA